MGRTRPDRDAFEAIYRKMNSLEEQLQKLKEKPFVTLPLNDPEFFPDDPIEQQVVIGTDGYLWYYVGGTWYSTTPAPAPFSGASVYRTTDYTTLNNSGGAPTFGNEQYDTDNYHSTSSNTSRLTIPADGYYRVTGHVEWAANSSGVRYLSILAGGSFTAAAVSQDPHGSLPDDMEVTVDIFTTAGNYLELGVNQDSGGNLDLLYSGAGQSRTFQIHRLGLA